MARPIIAMFDDFFDDPADIFVRISGGEFRDIQNPVDGVTYPGINAEIPLDIKSLVANRLKEILGKEIELNVIFARLTTKSLKSAPHKIHSDKIMGQYSMHVYLSKSWPLNSGTSFWSHVTECESHSDKTNVRTIIKDQNTESKWFREFICQGYFNRALIHDASLWHCVEPVGGWGKDANDGRLVLTTFFSEAEE